VITERTSKDWAVVLAAGEGRRLSSLTTALYGSELPKQFAVIDGARSLLQATLDRIAPLVPPERTVVVVGQEHGATARAQLRGYPGVDLVLQPKNLDTGPGILLPLSRILARDPSARVAIFPSDHHVANPAPFLEATRVALAATEARPDLVTLIGVVPDRPETEYGWILPGAPVAEIGATGLRDVLRFVEKPEVDVAQTLLTRGGLWNTFVSVARLSALWRLAAEHLPEHIALFELYAAAMRARNEAPVLQAIYEKMRPANFSRSVLERAESLSVLPVHGCGWSDWGTPERVYQSLAGLGRLESLRRRIALREPMTAAM
jgi:mannose-1-phosphate guanylyltransferase